MNRATDVPARWTWLAVGVAAVVGLVAQLPEFGGAVSQATWVAAVLAVAAAVGLLVRRLPQRRGVLLGLLGSAVVVELVVYDAFDLLTDRSMVDGFVAGHLDLWGLLPTLALGVTAAVVAVGRDEPDVPSTPSASVVVGAVVIGAAAIWWTLGGGPLGMAPNVQPALLVIGIGGAALSVRPLAAAAFVAVVALLADPVSVLLAPLGGIAVLAEQLSLWGPVVVLVALLLSLDERRRVWESRTAVA